MDSLNFRIHNLKNYIINPTKKELQEELELLQSKLKEQDNRIYFLVRHIAYLEDRLDEYKVGYDIQGSKHLTDSE